MQPNFDNDDIAHLLILRRSENIEEDTAIQLCCPSCGCPVIDAQSLGITRLSVIGTCSNCGCMYDTQGPDMVHTMRPGTASRLWVPSGS